MSGSRKELLESLKLVRELMEIHRIVSTEDVHKRATPTLASESEKEKEEKEDPIRATARLIWERDDRLLLEESGELEPEEAVQNALINQITAILMEISGELYARLTGGGWIGDELGAIEKTEETVTNLQIEKALTESQLEEIQGTDPLEEAKILYQQRQLWEHVAYLSHGLTERYVSLYHGVMAYRGSVNDPTLREKFQEMEGLVDQYLESLTG